MAFTRAYPIKKPTSAPSTGSLLYQFLMKNLGVAASANHTIWYLGEEAKLPHPEQYAFRGDIPKGKTLELVALMGNPVIDSVDFKGKVANYTLKGNEDYVLVSDLSDNQRASLGIPANARGKDKVYNANFKKFEQLPNLTRMSNELASMAVPVSFSNYFGSKGNILYSEKDVLSFLSSAVSDLNSPQMISILHANNSAWKALNHVRTNGVVSGDALAEFYAQQPTDFYMKDVGTVLPMMFYAFANLGVDPVEQFKKIDIEVWGAEDAAVYMRKYLPK